MIANGGSKTNFFFQESVKSWWRYMYLNNRTTIYRDSFRPITICRGSMTFTWSPSIRWVPHHNVKRIKRNKKAFKGNLYSLGQLCLRAWDFTVDARETANFFCRAKCSSLQGRIVLYPVEFRLLCAPESDITYTGYLVWSWLKRDSCLSGT